MPKFKEPGKQENIKVTTSKDMNKKPTGKVVSTHDDVNKDKKLLKKPKIVISTSNVVPYHEPARPEHKDKFLARIKKRNK
jgi:hypothetical protein